MPEGLCRGMGSLVLARGESGGERGSPTFTLIETDNKY